ncbi:MAG TPA: efflux RND transporter periplasmic adaptor subunit [Candidatus Methylacidiphilales bacterium]|nr:efflux RND transporter periplasmic adaptor subunit [Candidatus Methylacidiphilales bacterium]
MPISQEIGAFVGDACRHYKLDLVTSSAVTTGQGLHGDYKQSSRRLRGWLKFAIAAAILMVIAAVLYHSYYNPTVARLLYLPMPVDAVRVQSMDLIDVSAGGGQVQQSATVTMSSRITSVISKVNINLGDIVTTNTVLYECDPRAVQAELMATQQAVENSKSAVELAKRQDDGNQKLKQQGLASEADLLTSASALASALSTQATAEESLVNAQLDLENTTVKSPVNGIILQRFINPSERITTNEETVQLGDLDNVYFLAEISEDKISSVETGLKAEVVFPAFAGEVFQGDVFFIDPKTNASTRAFTAYIKIANPGLKLKPGLSGFARITNKKHVLAIPNSALINPVGENASVFVITGDNHAVLRPVRFGMVTQGWTEIGDGLQEGDIVVTVGPLYLEDGDRVHYTLKEN